MTTYTYRSIVQAMKTSHKLLIALAALTLIAAISYTIYRNAQPRPKAAIELNTQTEGSTKQSPVPETTPQPTQTQETPKQLPVQTETTPVIAQAIPNPTPETGGVEISKPNPYPTTASVTVYGSAGEKEAAERDAALCVAYKNGELWAKTARAQQICQ